MVGTRASPCREGVKLTLVSTGPIIRSIGSEMSSQSAEPSHSSHHLELPAEEQLARAARWEPSKGPVLDDLSDEEEAAFLDAISR